LSGATTGCIRIASRLYNNIRIFGFVMEKPVQVADNSLSSQVTAGIVVLDQRSQQTIRDSLYDLGLQRAQVASGNARHAAKIYAKEKSPHLLIVDIAGLTDPALVLCELAHVCAPETRVVAIGDRNDLPLYRHLEMAGIADYLPKPLARYLVNRTFNSILQPHLGAAPLHTGKLVFVLGVRGGAGATALAKVAAFSIAETRQQRTALLDLDLYSGDSALGMKKTPPEGLDEAIENPSLAAAFDPVQAASCVTERLDLFASAKPLAQDRQPSEPAAAQIINRLLSLYRFVIVDIPAAVAIELKGLLTLPSTIFLISNSSLTAARDVARWREFLGPNRADLTVLHVLNQTDPNAGLSASEFAKAAGRAPEVIIPYARSVATLPAAAAIMRHHSLFNRKLCRVIDNLTGTRVEKSGIGFSRVFGKAWPHSAKE
jgi:pilus assembly protein CpaE